MIDRSSSSFDEREADDERSGRNGSDGIRKNGARSEQVIPRRGVLRAVAASEIEPVSVDWLWKFRIPQGMLTLLAGDPGLGKSLLTIDLAARLSRGTLEGKAGAALMLTAEDSLAVTVIPRLHAAGADLEQVCFPGHREGLLRQGLVLPDDTDKLNELVVAREVRLVVIDPLMAFLPSGVNSWQDQSVRGALAPLHRLAEETGAGVLIVAHLNKGQETDALRRIGGSVGLPAAARSVLLLARDPDDEFGERGDRRVLAHAKSNLGPLAESLVFGIEPRSVAVGEERIETACLRQLGVSSRTAADLLAVRSREAGPALQEAVEFLENELLDGPCLVTELEEAARGAGISRQTLKRAKARLAVSSEKAAFKGGWVWKLPAETFAGESQS